MTSPKRYYGKYRGTVLSNIDPKSEGRLLVQVPDVGGLAPSTWATPCFPATGKQAGMYILPQIGAGVWVEYEQGDPDFPIWSGCWFHSAAEVPALALAAPPGVPTIVIQTQGQNTLMLSDVPGPGGGILLKSPTGAVISVTDTGILISNGKGASILLAGRTVSINEIALVVT
jgi:uncharacterized protein involved in type VI secretion and phage assembly